MAIFIKLASIIFAVAMAYTEAFVATKSNNRAVLFNTRNGISTVPQVQSSVVAFAKKKRRRRKNSEINKDLSVTPESPVFDDDEDFLPEFDLEDDVVSSSSSSMSDIPLTSAKAQSSVDMNDPKVLEAMKGTSKGKALSATGDLVVDRDLEKRFKFDSSTVKDQSLPTNLASIASNPDRKIGKKAARNEERRRAAIEAKEAEEESESFLSKISIGEKDGEFNYVKFVEQGTWVGIFALIAWEVYINTPLVNRVAPLAPVVFESPSQIFII